MNKAILVGRMTRDPELRSLPSGMSSTSFSVAINRTFKNKEGNYDADFLNVVVFGKQADNVAKFCNKGSLVGVEGRIQSRSYDHQDGTKRYVTEIIADRVEFLGSKNSGSTSDVNLNVDSTYEYTGPIDAPNNDIGIDVPTEDPFKDFGNEVTLSDDDLPF